MTELSQYLEIIPQNMLLHHKNLLPLPPIYKIIKNKTSPKIKIKTDNKMLKLLKIFKVHDENIAHTEETMGLQNKNKHKA